MLSTKLLSPRFKSFTSLPVFLIFLLCIQGCSTSPTVDDQNQSSSELAPTANDAAVHNLEVQRIPRDTRFDLTKSLTAGFLIVDGVYNSELMAPYDIFHHTPFHTKPNPGIEVFTVSPDGEPVVSFEGLTIVPHHSFKTAPPIDILVIPSAEGSMDKDLKNTAMMDWVAAQAETARYLVTLCDGAFVLAEAGLLNGRTATTFPADQQALEDRYPEVNVVREVSFVHDGRMLTSQGGAKSYDVAMYLVDHLFGERVTQGVGRGLIIDWPPDPNLMPYSVIQPE